MFDNAKIKSKSDEEVKAEMLHAAEIDDEDKQDVRIHLNRAQQAIIDVSLIEDMTWVHRRIESLISKC